MLSHKQKEIIGAVKLESVVHYVFFYLCFFVVFVLFFVFLAWVDYPPPGYIKFQENQIKTVTVTEPHFSLKKAAMASSIMLMS